MFTGNIAGCGCGCMRYDRTDDQIMLDEVEKIGI